MSPGFLGGSDGKESACNAGDPGSIPGLGDPLEKEMAIHSSIFLPGKPFGQRSLESYNPQGRKELDSTERLTLYSSIFLFFFF